MYKVISGRFTEGRLNWRFGTMIIGRSSVDLMGKLCLSETHLSGFSSCLDLAAGASDLVAKARTLGVSAYALDLYYDQLPSEFMAEALHNSQVMYQFSFKQSDQQPGFVSGYWHKQASLERHEREVVGIRSFALDFESNSDFYRVGNMLERFPFSDNDIELLTITNSVFLNSKYDSEAVIHIISEAVRVASKEIRIYPTCSENGARNGLIDSLTQDLSASGLSVMELSPNREFKRYELETVLVIRCSDQPFHCDFKHTKAAGRSKPV